MKSTKHLPEGYFIWKRIDIKNDPRLMIRLTVASLILAPLFGLIFCLIGVWLHPQINSLKVLFSSNISPLGWLIGVIAANVLFIIAHEGIHGFFFWTATHQIPRFGFGGSYAFAAAPDWYIPGRIYFWIGASPLVVISLVGVFAIPVIPFNFLLFWILGLLINAAGSVGDIYVLYVLLRQIGNIMICNLGDLITIYKQIGQ